jgi:hypothetical protein
MPLLQSTSSLNNNTQPDQKTLSNRDLIILQQCYPYLNSIPIQMHSIAREFAANANDPLTTQACASLLTSESVGTVLVVILMHGFGGHYDTRFIPLDIIGGNDVTGNNNNTWIYQNKGWETIGLQVNSDGTLLFPHSPFSKSTTTTTVHQPTTSLEISRPMPCHHITIFAISWMETTRSENIEQQRTDMFNCALTDVLKQFKTIFGLLSFTEFRQFQLQTCAIPTIAHITQRILFSNNTHADTQRLALNVLGCMDEETLPVIITQETIYEAIIEKLSTNNNKN